MYFFCPSITQWSPTRRARVRRPAGLDPAPGSTRAATATAATISQEAIRVGPSFFCASVPKPTRTLASDAVVGAGHRPLRQRGGAELLCELNVLDQVEPDPTPLGRARVAEQPHLGRGPAQFIGTSSVRAPVSSDSTM